MTISSLLPITVVDAQQVAQSENIPNPKISGDITTLDCILTLTLLCIVTSFLARLQVQGPQRKVSVAVSGENIYFAWVTNKTGSDEVIFRSSNDAGGTFSDKITLSNTTDSSLQIDSIRP